MRTSPPTGLSPPSLPAAKALPPIASAQDMQRLHAHITHLAEQARKGRRRGASLVVELQSEPGVAFSLQHLDAPSDDVQQVTLHLTNATGQRCTVRFTPHHARALRLHNDGMFGMCSMSEWVRLTLLAV